MFNHDYELEKRYHPENFELFVVLNKWQCKNKQLVKAFQSAGFQIEKDKKVK